MEEIKEIKKKQYKAFKKILIEKEIKMTDVAKTLGLSNQALSYRLKEEQLKLSIFELNRLVDKYNLSEKEIASIVKG